MASVLDTYALTTLAKANTYLGLTADTGAIDAYIETIINRASDIIENYCHRKFKGRLYIKERYDGNDQEIIYLKQYPVLAINLDNLAWSSTLKKVTRSDGGSFIDDGFLAADKVLVQNSDDNSGLLTIATSGVAALVLTFTDTIVTDTDDDNVILSRFRELWINDDEIDEDDYEVNEDHIYYNAGFSEGHKNVRMTYYAGYATIPDDLEQACLKLIKLAYDKDEGIKSESLGPHSITYFDKEDMPKDIKSDLDVYYNQVV